MNKLVSIAIFIGLVLFADRRIFAAKPLVFLSAMAAKAPTPDDRVKDEDDDPGSKKSTIAEPSPTPIDQGQTENKPNDAKENVREEPRSGPSDQDRTENGDKKSNDQDVKNSNEMGRVELDAKKIEKLLVGFFLLYCFAKHFIQEKSNRIFYDVKGNALQYRVASHFCNAVETLSLLVIYDQLNE